MVNFPKNINLHYAILIMLFISHTFLLVNNIPAVAESIKQSNNKITVKIQPLTFSEPPSPTYKETLIEQKVLEKVWKENTAKKLSLDEQGMSEEETRKARENLDAADYASIEEKMKESQETSDRENYLLANEICKNIENNLTKKSILVVSNGSDIVIEVSIKKTTFDSLYGPRPIADIVAYKGKNAANDKVIFSGEFMQNYNFPFGSTKTPEQIGVILAKRIAKEIKKLRYKEFSKKVDSLLNLHNCNKL